MISIEIYFGNKTNEGCWTDSLEPACLVAVVIGGAGHRWSTPCLSMAVMSGLTRFFVFYPRRDGYKPTAVTVMR